VKWGGRRTPHPARNCQPHKIERGNGWLPQGLVGTASVDFPCYAGTRRGSSSAQSKSPILQWDLSLFYGQIHMPSAHSGCLNYRIWSFNGSMHSTSHSGTASAHLKAHLTKTHQSQSHFHHHNPHQPSETYHN
jgi:hypothetical protein